MSVETSHNRGSEWGKWDLHVHTPASSLGHSLGDDWNAYVERLIDSAKAHQIVAIATADYFTIDGYKKLLNYYDQGSRTLSINTKTVPLCVIPGVELRLNIFNEQEHSINLHVFFDPDCSSDFITQNFLEQLQVMYRGSQVPLKRQNLLAIGKSISENTALNLGENFAGLDEPTGDSYVRKALGAVTLSYTNIHDALKAIDEIFGKQNLPQKPYLVAVVGKGHGGISSLKWFEVNKNFSRAGLIREHLTHQADIMFSNDPNDRQFYLGKHEKAPAAEIETRFSCLKPCVWGSDGHSLDKLLHPSNGNTLDYTWIKADLSFEGLKQITYEPELRVRVQQDDPSEEETYAKIETLLLDFPDDLKIKDKESTEAVPFCIKGKQEIELSPNLTCIIGGRGSGKSTLVHILYNLVPKRDTDRLSKVNSPLFNLQLGSKDELGKIRSLTKSDIPPSCEFFLQNEVEKFAKDINEMSDLVRARLYGLSVVDDAKKSLQQIESEWRTTAADVDGLVSAYDEITRIDQQISFVKKERQTLKKQTEVISSEEYKTLQKEIEQFAGAISSFDTYEKEYRRISLEISNLIKSIGRLDWSRYEGQAVLTSLSADLEKRKTELRIAFDEAKRKYDEADYSTQLNAKKTQLKGFLKDKGLSPENIGEVAAATQQIAEFDEQVKILRQERIPQQEVYDRKDSILEAYRKAYTSYKKEFEEVTNKLQSSLGDLTFDDPQTSISFELKTNDQLLKDMIVEFIKSNNPSRVSLRSDSIQNVLFGNSVIDLATMVSDKSKIAEVVSNSLVADVHTQIIQELVNESTFVEKLHLRMQRHHFDIRNIQVQTKLGEKLLQNTSFGERCGIVMAIVLVAGTNPIILDQPEDNLDGKYVSKVLVPLIRNQKLRRQIILVTRDANIAIGGDSELILILDKEERGTALLPATIENKIARPKYIWILDGGERAFQKREEKYAIKRTM
jgi:energy-coupling factor transporter ATP-binding protein EcfA2